MKNFDEWNKEKKNLQEREVLAPFHEREIWWCSIGVNLGHEEDGKNIYHERPVLVLKKFNNQLAWILPMTSVRKEGAYYFGLSYDGMAFTVMLSQLRLVSVKRFRRFIRKISSEHHQLIKEKIMILLD